MPGSSFKGFPINSEFRFLNLATATTLTEEFILITQVLHGIDSHSIIIWT